ncbi:MAG: glycosyltransferase family 39 protein, partial [Planctomycetota bacterium]
MRLPTSESDLRTDRVLAALIALVALSSRLMYLFGAPDRAWPHAARYEGDAPSWIVWARALRSGAPYEFDLPLRPPGVAYLLHWLDPGTIGPSFLGWKIAWCAVSAATCGLAYLAFRRGFPRRAALIACGLLVFSYGSALTATSLNNETLYTFLLVLLVWGTLDFNTRPRIALGIALGVGHGLATLL